VTTPDEEPQCTLEQFWSMAQTICANVAVFQPDLTIGLAHGGWALLYAAQVAWQAACRAPFPPMLRLNMGNEKHKRMETSPNLPRPFITWMCDTWDCAAALAWTAQQADWQVELAGMVAGVLGRKRKPRRILAVDDFIHEGGTYTRTLGLLNTTFPRADVRFLATLMEWRPPLMKEWLRRHHSDLFEHLTTTPPPQAQDSRRRLYHEYSADMRWLAAGTEDDPVGPESLAWRRITPASPRLRKLETLLPCEEWLKAPGWIYATIADYVRRRAGEDGWSPQDVHGRRDDLGYMVIGSTQRIMIHILLHGQVTRRDVVADCRMSRNRAHRVLRRLVRQRQIKQAGEGQATHYVGTTWEERYGKESGAEGEAT
jgi:hypothetical protein